MKSSKKKTAATEAEAQVTRFQAFVPTRIHRRQVTNAPYNPRTISDENRKQLRASLDSDHGGFGLITSITWNKLSGNITGGHQRLAVLDALEGSDNYLLDVDAVELTHEREVAANIALNNESLQGDWDEKLLADALKTPNINLKSTGFTLKSVNMRFTEPSLAGMFAPNKPTQALLTEVQQMQADGKPSKATRSSTGGDDSAADADGARELAAPAAKGREVMKKTRGENAANHGKDDTENYAVVQFESREEREAFVLFLGEDRDTRYVDGSKVVERMGLKLPAPKPKPQAPDAKPLKPPKPPKAPRAPKGSK
jgi:hypothetical protein